MFYRDAFRTLYTVSEDGACTARYLPPACQCESTVAPEGKSRERPRIWSQSQSWSDPQSVASPATAPATRDIFTELWRHYMNRHLRSDTLSRDIRRQFANHSAMRAEAPALRESLQRPARWLQGEC
ncbi:uncharacterized protein LOC117644987 [Thrips palmi]|uniref:Uncharacterized protein LOC117644987 n=1 Tax=Thrips palmi TaxID=161013 RepID=A0A6P8YUE8_THRPL|nr:uncharacterized protein LOC117644987 [Thrips palmi]